MGIMVHSSKRDLKAELCEKMILNNPTTLSAIKSNHDIFGPNVPSPK